MRILGRQISVRAEKSVILWVESPLSSHVQLIHSYLGYRSRRYRNSRDCSSLLSFLKKSVGRDVALKTRVAPVHVDETFAKKIHCSQQGTYYRYTTLFGNSAHSDLCFRFLFTWNDGDGIPRD